MMKIKTSMNLISKMASRSAKLVLKRPKGWKSLLYNTALAKMRIPGPLMPPVHISIEPTNVCNAKCPVCETGNGIMSEFRSKGMLDLDAYKKFIDETHKTTANLLFYFMGEPFLNRKAYEMIRYARQKDIYVETCTNGDFVDAEGVIYSDINQISFQIGGMDNETHQVYRVASELPRVIKNLEELVKLRENTPNSNVQIEVGFIVMKHNEHQVQDFLDWAADLGVHKVNIIDPCVRDMDEGERFLTNDKQYWYYDEEAYGRGILRPKHLPDNECTWIWNSLQLNWNGDAVPCCRDPLGINVYGNVFESGLNAVWNGDRAMDFRRKILGEQGKVSICKLCSGYGVPDLDKEPAGVFQVERHTMNPKSSI